MFFFNDTATTEIYTLSLHDALPICDTDEGLAAEVLDVGEPGLREAVHQDVPARRRAGEDPGEPAAADDEVAAQVAAAHRSEEHTSELQSRQYLVCRLLLEKKKIKKT